MQESMNMQEGKGEGVKMEKKGDTRMGKKTFKREGGGKAEEGEARGGRVRGGQDEGQGTRRRGLGWVGDVVG